MVSAVSAEFTVKADAQRVFGRQTEFQACIDQQAVAIQWCTGNSEVFPACYQTLAGFAVDVAERVFPAGTESWRQLHAVIQRIEFCQSQAECAVHVVLGLTVDFQRSGAAFLRIAVSLIALITKAGERFNAGVGAAQVVADFRECLLGVGVVTSYGRSLKPLKATRRFVFPS